MKLAELLAPWLQITLNDDEIIDLHNDSRFIKPGMVFLAYPGASTDGRRYISQAMQNGARFIVFEPTQWPEDCPMPAAHLSVAFPNLAGHLALISSRFYGTPSKQLEVFGVTGTNGKTTIAYQLAEAHDALSKHATYIGTLGEGRVNALNQLANTTPDALCLQHLLSSYVKEGVQQVCMEVSSHALSQHRVDEIDFKQAIFTNLTLDHLDYHRTMEAYAEAKALLFSCPTLQWAIINNDDSYTPLIKKSLKPSCQLITYGLQETSQVRALHWDVQLTGTTLGVLSPWGEHTLRIKALGFFNIYNALAVFTSLAAYGYPLSDVIKTMAHLSPAPGRMEIVSTNPYVIVDYAHTPDALENVLRTLTDLKKGRLIVVFGCGGDRDKSKRPIMGGIAARYADIAIITSDNPRNENPEQIMKEIALGMGGKTPMHSIVDREQAIDTALALAKQEDIILVAGKGHESYQQVGTVYHRFSDQAVIRRLSA